MNPRRADARRNRQAVLDTALELFRTDPSATMTEIAAAAGVGRVTLHGHFPTRTELVVAVVDEALGRAGRALDHVDLDTDPAQALDRLVAATWSVLADGHAAVEAARRVLPADQVDALHQPVTDRLAAVMHRCVAEQDGGGDERWLVVAVSALMHAAAAEVTAGRVAAQVAVRRLRESVAALVGAGHEGSD